MRRVCSSKKNAILALLASIVTSACGGGSAGGPDASGGAPADGAAGGDASTSDAAETRVRDWTQVEAAMRAAAADAGVTTGFGLAVWSADDQRLYEHMENGFSADTRVAVASASKLVSGLVIFDAIRRGELSLDSTTGQVLGWTGANAAITLRELLSFTSGLVREDPCTLNPLSTLARCVDKIRDTTPAASPGASFEYGSTHLQVAARMAEVASGRSWANLFADTLRDPLALGPDVTYFTLPKQQTGVQNPLIAGGLRASMNEYAPLLAIDFHRGSWRGLNIGTPALFEAQAREPFPDVAVTYSPVAEIGLDYRYGLTAWLMCDTPAAGCASISSPGAFGFTPWLDRAAGYYAILGMELPRDSVDTGVVDFAVKLSLELAPLIREQL
jgi:CubicO group peptidase (beta-lactamase class C family)